MRISRCRALQEALHLPAELGVERAERLVEQDQPRLADDGAGERHALLLAAGELRGIALAEIAERDQLQRLRRRARGFPPCRTPRTARP